MISTADPPRLGEAVLSQSRRARRISISVRGTGCVRLSFPCGVSARRAMEFLECKAGWVEAARARLAQRRAALPPQLPPAAEKARVEELRRAAKADLPDRIGRLSRITGLKYNKLTIRASRTKWGSCTGTNNISLSLFMMTLPEQLCHTVHHDHSPKFHALVDRLVGGNEKALNRELKAFSIRG